MLEHYFDLIGRNKAKLIDAAKKVKELDGKEVDCSKMLSSKDIARAAKLIIEQEESSNIDHILLLPGKTY